ncbi:hypothetical protein GHT06_020202 [Daphnia sinensis]|uniref:DUF4806 domain-containing protein n=1 Tax=Daphnia sinensis TaxID=1820382 RepID=A0AAD5KL51_9CRUS|nr:hypothetical protein GHT06_020202 [Daphnia sinensis]
MASSMGLSGIFFIVDLIDGSNHLHVTVVPDIWILQNEENSSNCWYPKVSVRHISSKKREVPKPYWYVYPCVVRKEYDSYEAARSQEHIATIQSDINSECDAASQPNTSLGRGKRNKRATKRFLPSSSEPSSDESSVGVYGPTQTETMETPTIPVGLLTGTVLEVQGSCRNSFEEVSQHVTDQMGNSTYDNQPIAYNNLNSQGSVALIAKLEYMSNMMAKLVVMESKMESQRQSAAEPQGNPEFLLEPLKESEQLQVLEESLSDPDIYYQLVGMIRSLGGASIRDALKRAWYRVFSIKVMASVNWEGKIKKGSLQKQGLKQSIVTKAVFDGVRTTSRKSNNFELETETKKIMKAMPEKYQKRCAAEKLISNEVEIDGTLCLPGTSAASE